MTALALALLAALGPAQPAATTADARDPHSFGNVDEVRPTHLSLDLTLRFDSRTILGVTDLTLAYPRGKGARQLFLDTRDLKVTAVKDGATGKALAFTADPPVQFLGQRLAITLPQPAPRRVRVEYETSPGASALQWLDPAQTTSGRMPFLFTQSESIHARSWIPTAGHAGRARDLRRRGARAAGNARGDERGRTGRTSPRAASTASAWTIPSRPT